MPETPATYSFSNLSKVYRIYEAPRDRLVEALTGRPRHAEVHALRGVSGGIEKGAVLGVIGENGSGKSTLFKILAGTTAATSGSVNIPGRIASILELGSSFHPEDTGRRNVILQAALAGLSREEVARRAARDRGVRRARRLLRPSREDVLVGHADAPRVLGRDGGPSRT